MIHLAPRMYQSQIPSVHCCTDVPMASGQEELRTQFHANGEDTPGISVMNLAPHRRVCLGYLI